MPHMYCGEQTKPSTEQLAPTLPSTIDGHVACASAAGVVSADFGLQPPGPMLSARATACAATTIRTARDTAEVIFRRGYFRLQASGYKLQASVLSPQMAKLALQPLSSVLSLQSSGFGLQRRISTISRSG
jgi:hypothetical protein